MTPEVQMRVDYRRLVELASTDVDSLDREIEDEVAELRLRADQALREELRRHDDDILDAQVDLGDKETDSGATVIDLRHSQRSSTSTSEDADSSLHRGAGDDWRTGTGLSPAA